MIGELLKKMLNLLDMGGGGKGNRMFVPFMEQDLKFKLFGTRERVLAK